MRTTVIYEDHDIIVVHKPAGIATQTARIGEQDVVSELKNYFAAADRQKKKQAPAPYAGVVHRLDQPVEGLLVFGKNAKATSVLSRQIKSREFTKKYFAAVCGQLSLQEGRLVDYLVKDNRLGRARIVEPNASQAKKAILEYRVLDRLKIETEALNLGGREASNQCGISFSLLDIHILTGRFHQIRVQMANTGCPLLGDRKYGNENTVLLTNVLEIPHVALCAYHIEFLHPVTGIHMEYTVSPQNKAFAEFQNFLL